MATAKWQHISQKALGGIIMWKEKFNQICTLSKIFGEKINGGARIMRLNILLRVLKEN